MAVLAVGRLRPPVAVDRLQRALAASQSPELLEGSAGLAGLYSVEA
jgi:hypothetical protein